MIAQRPPGAAPAVLASAEALPLADSSVDAAMAVLSDHHWADRARGLAEMRRVARRRVVVFQFDPAFAEAFWMTRDYLPTFLRRMRGRSLAELMAPLGPVGMRPVPIPHDCVDGFFSAHWRRPEAFLDPRSARASRSSTCSPPTRSPRASRACAPTSTAARGRGATPGCSSSTSSTSASASCSPSSADGHAVASATRQPSTATPAAVHAA